MLVWIDHHEALVSGYSIRNSSFFNHRSKDGEELLTQHCIGNLPWVSGYEWHIYDNIILPRKYYFSLIKLQHISV